MPLLNSPIPNLIGGISQQPPSIRTSSEAQDILNAVPSAVEGLTKRPPSEFLFSVTNGSNNPILFPTSTPPFIHVIERDNDEKYLLTIANDGTPYVHTLAGVKKTVTVYSGLTLGTAKPSERTALTIGDVTFISNKNTKVTANNALKASVPAYPQRAGLIWIRQGNYNRTHTVKMTSTSNGNPTFSHTSIGTIITNSGSGGIAGTYSGTFTRVSGDTLEVYPQGTITIAGGKVTDLTITNAGSGFSGNDNNVVLTTTLGSLTGFRFDYAPITDGDVGTLHVAQSLMYGGKNGYVGQAGGLFAQFQNSKINGNVISLVHTTGNTYDFNITVEDDFAGDGLTFIRDTISRLEDLPPVAPHGYIVKVTGTDSTRTDDYWVEFKANDGVFSEGIWFECTGPGQKYLLEVQSMPKILIRQSNGTFMLKYADGLTPTVGQGTPTGSDYSAYNWTPRTAGDDDTNAFPSFFNSYITGMIYHQGRLGLLSSDNIIFSETGEFFNFFRTTVLDVLDTDPIDIASSTPRVGNITAALQFNRDVILFTPTSQMVLRSGDVLSPKTVALAPASEFENLSGTVKPFASANSIFFTYINGGYAGVRELVPQSSLDGAYYANDLTNNVPRLIPNSVTHLTATTHDNIAMVVSGGNLYGYRYFTSGADKLQSAWFRFDMPDPTMETAQVLWCQFINSDLYIASLRGGTSENRVVVFEKMRMGAGINDVDYTGYPSITYLDNRCLLSAGTGNYNSGTNRTTFTLPKSISYDVTKTEAVSVEGYVLSILSGTAYNTSSGTAGTIQVLGDYSDSDIWIGTTYNMVYVFSTPYLKGQAGRGVASITSGRYQLRYLNLQYADSGYFRVSVAVKNEDIYEYLYTGITLGTDLLDTAQADTGTFRVPLFSKNDNITITINNDTHQPSKILSGELEAYYSDRAERTPQ